MATLDYMDLVAKVLKGIDSTFPQWYFEIPEEMSSKSRVYPKKGAFSPPEIEITHCDGIGIVEAIGNKKYTCVEVI